MPTISMFYGIIIRMYFAPKEHNSPHIHVYYNDLASTFSLKTGEIVDGEIPNRQRKLVEAWIVIHKEDLMADWDLCMNGEQPFKIDPLK